MKKSIFASFLTTVSRGQCMLSLSLFFQPWKRLHGGSRADLALALTRYLWSEVSEGAVHCFYNARSALYHSLVALGVQHWDYVILQSYTCVSVVNAIKATWAIPLYVDISPDDLNMTVDSLTSFLQATTWIKALIVQHTLWLVAPLDEIRSLCVQYNIPMVEDCAHALWAAYHGKKVWLFGDISVFSFGRDKIVSSVNGGIALINNKRYVDYFSSLILLPVPRFVVVKNLLYAIFWYISWMLYDVFYLGKLLYYCCAKLWLFPPVVSLQEKHCNYRDFYFCMPNALAILALRELLVVDNYNTHRRMIAHYYKNLLGDRVVVPSRTDVYDVYLRVVYRCLGDRSKVVKRAKQMSIFLGDWYQHVVAPKDVLLDETGYEWGRCPIAESLADETVNLPNSYCCNKLTVDRIVSLLE